MTRIRSDTTNESVTKTGRVNDSKLIRDKEYLIYLMFSNVRSMTLNAALHMDLFECLHEKWLSVDQISELSSVHPPKTFLPELCDTLTALNLIAKRKNEDGIDVYSNKHGVDKYCRRESAFSLNNLCKFNAVITKPLIGRIKPTVINGSRDVNNYETTEKDKGICETFQNMMTEICNTSKQLVTAFDLSHFKNTIDLGGGTGSFARFMKKSYPKMNLSVIELPRVTELSLAITANKEANIQFIAGSFFAKLPPADLYCLGHVLHNWSEEECHDILCNVIDALNPGGAVLVLDSVLNPDRIGPLKSNLVEIMQLSTLSGEHRTLIGYKTILRRNGFVRIKHKTADNFSFYDAIIAFKP